MSGKDWWGEVRDSAGTGAAVGAALGTVVPGVGNVVGAAVGTVGGGIVGLATHLFPETLGAVMGGSDAAKAAPLVEAAVRETTGATTPAAVLSALAADPAKEAELQAKLGAIAIEFERIAAADRANARQREIAVKDWTPRILAYIAVVGTFAMLAALMVVEIPEGNQRLFDLILGAVLGTGFAGSFNYFLGSSAGSARKTDLLAVERERR